MSATGGLDCAAEGNDQTKFRTTFSGALQKIPRRKDVKMIGWYESSSFMWSLTLVSKMNRKKNPNFSTRKLVVWSWIWKVAFDSKCLKYLTCHIRRYIFTTHVSYLVTAEFLMFIALQFTSLYQNVLDLNQRSTYFWILSRKWSVVGIIVICIFIILCMCLWGVGVPHS